MKVSSLIQKKNGIYEVSFGGPLFLLDEDTILSYRLFMNKDISTELWAEIQQFDVKKRLEKQALDYALRYGKSSQEVCRYLEQKEFSKELAHQIVNHLIEQKWIDDDELASSMASHYARNGNGPLLIREKLKNHLFSGQIIDKVLSHLNEDDVEIGIEKLQKKFFQKYHQLDEWNQKLKWKEYFYRHGYSNIEMPNLK